MKEIQDLSARLAALEEKNRDLQQTIEPLVVLSSFAGESQKNGQILKGLIFLVVIISGYMVRSEMNTTAFLKYIETQSKLNELYADKLQRQEIDLAVLKAKK